MKTSRKILTKEKILSDEMPIVLYKAVREEDSWKTTWMSSLVEKSTGFPYNNFKYDPQFWWSRLHADDKNRVSDAHAAMLRGDSDSVDMTFRWLHRDGNYHWFIDHAVLVRDDKNNPSELIGSWVDVSVHAIAEKTIEDNEDAYRQLIELCPYPIVVESEGSYVLFNTAAIKLFEADSLSEVTGMPVANFVHPDYQEAFQQRLDAVSNDTEDSSMLEYKFLTSKGNIKTLEVAARGFAFEGKPASQHILIDITKHKQTEDYLRSQREELEQLNRILMKRQLSGSAASPDAARGEQASCASSFDPEKSVLTVNDQEVKIQKYSKQYYLLNIIFQNFECSFKDWQFSEISELMDMEALFEWKKLYNIADAIRKNVAIATGIKDFFIMTTQSVKINPNYLKS